MALHDVVAQAAQSLGLEVVEIERSPGGTLRVTVDWPWVASEPERFVQVEQCEVLTRQLQYALEVEAVGYERLEVSSPGIDRLIRSAAEFERFEGEVIDLVLKEPIGAVGTASGVNSQRKKFRGVLARSEAGWALEWSDAPEPKPGVRVSKKKGPQPVNVLGFEWHELKEVRLAPIVDFKGRAAKTEKVGSAGDEQKKESEGAER